MNVYIGWPVEYSDMQWPCPDGFHVPLSSEWIAIYNAWISLWAWGSSDGNNFSTYLKIPMAWMRNYYTDTSAVGSYGYYWSSNYDSSTSALILTFISYYLSPNDTWRYCYGLPIRWIKNSPVTPTSSWTTLYQWSWSAGIYYNPTDWLISISSDGSTWYTLMDKNLWATTVYNYWDTLTDANCGNVFQRWNNYPFPWTLSSDSITTSGSQVNASDYWPWNYYESSTWIQNSWAWFYPSNYNLRWWMSKWGWTKNVEVKNIYLWEYVPDFATQWPCPHGFHVPIQTEWQWLKTIMDWLGLTTWDSWKINLHIPFSWVRDYYNSNTWWANSFVYYWSSTPSITDQKSAYAIQISSWINIVQYNRWYGFPIRPFYKEFVKPTSSWVVIQWTLWSAWIFWNQTDWLISITSDGTTWYTITDKNLWATTVYNNWDTLTQANMWNMYQWWNNYWFTSTWTISKTSSTQVDASNYWPWNYYESDTFIIRSGDWSSVRNANLRWWEDWNVPVS